VFPATHAQKGYFCVSNGSVTHMQEGFAQQTQVMLLKQWLSNDVASRLIEIGVKLEAWFRRYSWKKIKNVFSIQKEVEKYGMSAPGKG
jgi:hypothetical protein